MAPQIKTELEMFPLVEGWLESGLTQKQFCATHQLPVHILAYWVGKYRKAKPNKAIADKAGTSKSKTAQRVMATDRATNFIRLALPHQTPAVPVGDIPASTIHTGNMEVTLPTGAVIRFSTTIPVSYLKELLSQCSH